MRFRAARVSGAATNEYRPQDAYVGSLIGALRAIDAGITTITDLSQVSNGYSRGSGTAQKWPDGRSIAANGRFSVA
jgi:hypothetical protein